MTGGRATDVEHRLEICSTRPDRQHHDRRRDRVLARVLLRRGRWRGPGVEALAAPLQARDAGAILRLLAGELVAERGGILADLVDPGGPLERLRERRDRCHHVLHGRTEVPEDLGGLHAGIASDRNDGRRPHEDHLRLGGDLVDHRDGEHADSVVEDHHIRMVGLDHAGELGGALGLTHDVEALALEDEAKEPLLRRSALADDDPYRSRHLCLPRCPGERTPRTAAAASAFWGFSWRRE
jgi:hypothetical protein